MNGHFSVEDGVLGPQLWMQQRLVATAEAPSVSRSYAPIGGAKNDLVHTVSVSWTNNTPIAQQVYGLVTRGGVQVALTARSRGYLAALHGVEITGSAEPPTSWNLVEVSRHGCGLDVGGGGLLGLEARFGVQEYRAHSATAPLMPHMPGMWLVEPGQTIHARVELRFVAPAWEATGVEGGEHDTESGFISGDTRLDLVAIPLLGPPPSRPTPTVVGVSYAMGGVFGSRVDLPDGVQPGDVILAVSLSHWALLLDIQPMEPGWSLLHQVGAGPMSSHGKVYWRIAGEDEPSTYGFSNSLMGEQITHLIVLRDASTFLDDGWAVASVVRREWWLFDDAHTTPSIDRNGQLLLAVSFVPFNPVTAVVSQTVPEGMTELSSITGAWSSCAVAALADPPRPTGERRFTVEPLPSWSTHSIGISILVPGAPLG